ncbi:hypothetical protein AZ34_11835 [Hylemonella gracilis str. Niagara R]|uniref:Baseplate protein n=1 Tax=Hylemonella gracilis str. Niagara R TaxID=1458275 RepID=A0A016XHX9_9BURK|nr:contractile injection system protein, VgrG/Pvc8 family [Hylemonella gracilis]EYC51699.1 hypothetical protein AZ34_11835 [Hylemonella gracilis str. Niagara R]
MANADDMLTLRVGGQNYAGWTGIRIPLSLEQLAGSFSLSLTERWPGQPTSWAIPPGEFCEVLIGRGEGGGTPVISGYVDTVNVGYDGQSHSIDVAGRDKAGDLVDCSAPIITYKDLTFGQIADKLLAPYNMQLTWQVAQGKKIPVFTVQPGESVYRALDRLAKQEAILLISDAQTTGGLIATRAGKGGFAGTALRFGQNIKAATGEHSHLDLFSEISVQAQQGAGGAEEFNVSKSAPKGTVRRNSGLAGSSAVLRHRPLLILAETQADGARCQIRAEWEAARRQAQAQRYVITVQGWRRRNGELWRLNQIVSVWCPWLRVDGDLLIVGVNYVLDDQGTRTELIVIDTQAYVPLPEIPAPGKGKKFDLIG